LTKLDKPKVAAFGLSEVRRDVKGDSKASRQKESKQSLIAHRPKPGRAGAWQIEALRALSPELMTNIRFEKEINS
jgi:hypothetical protein